MVGNEDDVDAGANALNLPRQNHSVPCISGEQCVGKQNVAALFPGQPFSPARIAADGDARAGNDLSDLLFHPLELGSVSIYAENIHRARAVSNRVDVECFEVSSSFNRAIGGLDALAPSVL